MKNITIHIGAPRTGTTVLQKHAFKKAQTTQVISKVAYQSSGLLSKINRQGELGSSIGSLRNQLNYFKSHGDTTLYFKLIMTCLLGTARDQPIPECIELVKDALDSIESDCPSEQILFSSERLCDSSASLDGDSKHTKTDSQPGVYSFSSIITDHLSTSVNICLCLRQPIKYLRSKYLRTAIQRAIKKKRPISAIQFIQKQSILETNYPGTSALAPAMHSEFIKRLQKHAFVKAFGFQELLASDDVFSLMGLQGEGKYAFRDFPRENKLPFSTKEDQAIEIEITQALKKYGFYDRIIKAQMFD